MFIQWTVIMKYLTLLFTSFFIFNTPFVLAESKDAEQTIVVDKSVIDAEKAMEQQISDIRELLDPLMLEDNPRAEFKKMLPKIKKFSAVKKADFKGKQFYIEFKNGSSNSWDMPK